MSSDRTDRRQPMTDTDYESLAAFRHALRRYLSAVTANAQAAGLTHHQHQALLSIRGGYPGRQTISIGELADHLLIKNHTAVELVARLEKADLIRRERAPEDRRRVLVSITPAGERVLERLAESSFHELRLVSGVMSNMVSRLGEFEAKVGGAAADR